MPFIHEVIHEVIQFAIETLIHYIQSIALFKKQSSMENPRDCIVISNKTHWGIRKLNLESKGILSV